MDALDCSSGCNPNWTRARESSNRAWPEPDKRSVFYVQTSLEPHTVTVRERLHSGAAAETHSQLSFQRCVHFLVSLLKQTERQHSEDVQIQSSCPIGPRWLLLGPVGSPRIPSGVGIQSWVCLPCLSNAKGAIQYDILGFLMISHIHSWW